MQKPQALIEQLTERLCARIIRNGLEPGDILGAERQLALDFGVAYGTMREAVNRLRALGIIISKPRVGLIVNKAAPVKLFGQLMPFITFEASDVSELLQFRMSIELGSLELVFENGDEKILNQMEETIEPFEKFQRAGKIEEADPYDIQFHSLLLEASGNKLLAGLGDAISSYFVKSGKKYPNLAKESDPDRITDHRNLLNAIRSKNHNEGINILRIHLRGFKLDGNN